MLKPALFPALLAAACLFGALAAPAKARQPVVVELFTSQGCSACAKANALIGDLDGRSDVLALTFPVDYWDYLGWRDTFAKPPFAERQRAYMKTMGLREVYTPQLVVDGVAEAGRGRAEPSLADKAPALITAAARRGAKSLRLRLRHGRLTIGAGPAPRGGADVWLIRYEAQPPEVAVKDGENRGQTVAYHNVARELTRLGGWSGRASAYPLAKGVDDGLKTAVLVQSRTNGRILGALAP